MVLHPLTTLVCDAQHKNIDVAVRPCRPALARLQQEAALFVGYVNWIRGCRVVVQSPAVTKRAIVGAAFLIAGAGLLFHGRMSTQPTHGQISPPHTIRCADVIDNSPCSPRQQQQRLNVEPLEFFPRR
jgi:hypothetical protein